MNRPVPFVVPVGAGPGPVNAATFRREAIRGGAVTGVAQILKFALTIASTVLLARLLAPPDYGLFAMVTGFTGLLEIFKDGGLSLATIQQENITRGQLTTLFWTNTAVGGILMSVTLGLTPLATLLYAEPRLNGMMAALAGTFLLSGLGVQHLALLRRNLRFVALAVIEISALAAGIAAALLLAWRGYGYWALVAMAIVSPLVGTVAAWLAEPWRPGPAAPFAAIRGLLGFGGNIIATRFVYQFVRGTPNVLLGWFWGPVATGLYQRAYALLMFAVDQIQGPVASVILPQLARLQREPERLKAHFLLGYRMIVSLVVPLVATCAVFSGELVALLLGPQWHETGIIFRWLALGGIFVGLLYPQGLLLLALGRADLCIRLSLLDATGAVIGYAAGLPYGPVGVAAGFCVSKVILAAPLTVLTFRCTPVTWREVVRVVRVPLLATLAAVAAGGVLRVGLARFCPPPTVAIAGVAATLALYALCLLGVGREWPFYRSLLADLQSGRPSALSA